MKPSVKYFLFSVLLIIVCFLLIPLIFFYETNKDGVLVEDGDDRLVNGSSIPTDDDSLRESSDPNPRRKKFGELMILVV